MCRGKHKQSRGWNSSATFLKCSWGRGPSSKGEEGQTKKEEPKKERLPQLREDCSQEGRVRWRHPSSLAGGAAAG